MDTREGQVPHGHPRDGRCRQLSPLHTQGEGGRGKRREAVSGGVYTIVLCPSLPPSLPPSWQARKHAVDALSKAPRSKHSLNTTAFGTRNATGRLHHTVGAEAGVNGGAGVAAGGALHGAPLALHGGTAGAMDRITDLDPGWQYVVEVSCEHSDLSDNT